MSTRVVWLIILAWAGAVAAQTQYPNCRHHRSVVQAGPNCLEETSSIQDILQQNSNVHILYVHGIAQEGAGDSLEFQKAICERFECVSQPKAGQYDKRDYADQDDFDPAATPPPLEYFANSKLSAEGLVWRTKKEWTASAPFVDHYRIQLRSPHRTIYVDEINWWPLVYPLKCRYMVANDARLMGPNRDYLCLCSANNAQPKCSDEDLADPQAKLDPDKVHFISYPWIDHPDGVGALPERAAAVNHYFKGLLIDWGFSDAVMALGPLGPYLQEAMRQLIVKSRDYSADLTKRGVQEREPEFILVTHSLGSYLVFSTLQSPLPSITKVAQDPPPGGVADRDICDKLGAEGATEPASQQIETTVKVSSKASLGQAEAACYIFAHTSQVYFFANQLSLLELANLGGQTTTEGFTPVANLRTWERVRKAFLGADGFRKDRPQLVAWSDPSDLLTLHVPRIDPLEQQDGLRVVNLYVRNAPHWFWLAENPGAAHSHYATNRHVVGMMFRNPDSSKEDLRTSVEALAAAKSTGN